MKEPPEKRPWKVGDVWFVPLSKNTYIVTKVRRNGNAEWTQTLANGKTRDFVVSTFSYVSLGWRYDGNIFDGLIMEQYEVLPP